MALHSSISPGKGVVGGNQAYQTEYKDTLIQLAELDLVFLNKDKTVLETDVPDICDRLFKKDPTLLTPPG